MSNMKSRKIFIISMFFIITPFSSYLEEIKNYSREMQQAITLYREGKNPDALDRFMDILVNGTPQEKALANEYISKITQGIKYNEDPKIDNSVKTSTSTFFFSPKTESQSKEVKNDKLSSTTDKSQDDADISLKVARKIDDIKNSLLYALYRKNFLKIYIDNENKKVEYILIKEDLVFNEDVTFNEKVIDDMSKLAGLITVFGKVQVTVVPKGAISGNMKISNIRKATVLHSFFTSYGISPSKIKLDLTGNSTSISKKVDDRDGIILAFDYSNSPELKTHEEKPQVSLSIYPSKINLYKDEAAMIEFSVIEGKNPISSWKLLLNKIEKEKQIIMQKIEDTYPTFNQIYFNGREKTVGSYYPSGEYEFFLQATDVKGNTVSVKRSFYIEGDKLSNLNFEKERKEESEKTKIVSSSQKTTTSNLWKIYFNSNTLNITDISKENVRKIVEEYKRLKKDPKIKIYITGFAFIKEKDAKKLAYKRAEVVKNYLIKTYKVNPKRIVVNYEVVKFYKKIVEVRLK